MFFANLRVAIAWAVKQPFYYSIKVLGLAMGIMSAALLIAYVDFVKGYDSHIPNRDNLYRLVGEYVSRENGDRVRYDFGSNAWIEPFKSEYAGLYSDAGVLVGRNGVLAHETLVYDQEYFFADQGAISLLGIHLLDGNPASALSGPNKVVLSESAAVKYFGTSDDIIGRMLTLDQVHYLGVSGVFQDPPKQTNFPMEALVSLETTERVLSEATLRNQLWIMFNRYTLFVAFDNPELARTVNQDLPEFVYRRSPEQDLPILERNQFTLRLQPVTDIYLDPLTGNVNGDDFTRRNTYFGIWILSLLVILGACVNYISLTIGQLQLRFKELGVRTSFGATKSTLLFQLLSESLVVSVPAVLLSVQLLYALVPAFSSVVSVPLETADVVALELWGWLAMIILLICAFVSAAPLAFSSPDTVKGAALGAPHRRFSWRAGGAVVFFQFAISTLTALMVLGIYLQIHWLQSVGAGFDSSNLITMDTRYEGSDSGASGLQAFKSELTQVAEVESLAAISVNPPFAGSFTNWIWAGDGEPVEHTVSHIRVDPDFLSTYQIPLVAGRNFSLDFPSELISEGGEAGETLGILVTENAVRRFGIESPERAIGQRFRYTMDDGDRTYVVIGVVDDFKFSPMESDVRSVAILQGTAEPLRNITVRVSDSYDAGTIDRIEGVWNRHLPGVPFNLSFMEELIDAEIEGRTESLSLAASMASIVFFCTAIIGIYAQASFVCDRHAKSIAIRKVLGSSKRSILSLLLMRFTLPVVASFVLALPIAVYFIGTFYSSFQETPGFPVHYYVICLTGIAAIALTTVFAHCRRAAARHPIHNLRYE